MTYDTYPDNIHQTTESVERSKHPVLPTSDVSLDTTVTFNLLSFGKKAVAKQRNLSLKIHNMLISLTLKSN